MRSADAAGAGDRGARGAEAQKQRAELRLAAAGSLTRGAHRCPRATDYDYAADAAAVPLLRQDSGGVLINVDDDVLDVETPRDARNDGGCSTWRSQADADAHAARGVGALYKNQLLPRNAWTPQLVDATPLARDSVVLLVGTPVAINDGKTRAIRRSRATTASSGSSAASASGTRSPMAERGAATARRGSRASRATTSSSTGGRTASAASRHRSSRPGQGPADHGERCGEWLAPLTLLERAVSART